MSHNEEIIKKLETEILKDPFKVFRRFYTSLYFPGFAHLKAGLFPKSLLFPVTGMLLIILVIFSFSRQYSIRAVYNSLHKFALYKDSYSTTRPDKDKFIRNLNNDITSFNKALRSGKRARMVLTLEKHVNNILTIFQNEYNQKTAEDNTRLSTIIKELQAVKDNLPAVKKELQAKQKKVRLKYKAKIQQELEKAEESTTKEALGNEVQDLQEQKEKELKQTRFAVHNKYAEAYKTSLAPVLHSYLSSSAFIDLLYEHKQAGFWSLIVFLVLLFLFIGFWAYTVYDFVRLLKFGALNRMLTAVRDGFGFLSLNVLGFLIFIFGPVIFAIYLAFNEWDILTEMLWVGWANFKELFTDPLFWKYLGNTFFFFINVPLGMAASLMLAIALNQRIKGITFFRVLFYL
ncbi:MAG TPA: hypothetical protein VKS21_05475, partial [Spirochaetota bacterium]|nr:hypothetical protein [Spirochaetota bacterium]